MSILGIRRWFGRCISKVYSDLNQYYDRSFADERNAVLCGIRTRTPGFYAVRLNRNTHRIEKGLSLPERKQVFAEEYIVETVKAFRIALKHNPDYQQLKWNYDTLSRYFEAVRHTPTIIKALKLFETAVVPDAIKSAPRSVPVKYSALPPCSITAAQFSAFCRERHSLRHYDCSRQISPARIKACAETALLAPSACNRQPLRFEYVDDEPRLRRLRELPPGCDGFHGRIPAMLFLIGDLSAFEHVRDRHIIYLDGGMASMIFMQALVAEGLGCCPLNWPAIPGKDNELARILHLKPYERCVICFAIGVPHPDAMVPFPGRKSVEGAFRHINADTN